LSPPTLPGGDLPFFPLFQHPWHPLTQVNLFPKALIFPLLMCLPPLRRFQVSFPSGLHFFLFRPVFFLYPDSFPLFPPFRRLVCFFCISCFWPVPGPRPLYPLLTVLPFSFTLPPRVYGFSPGAAGQFPLDQRFLLFSSVVPPLRRSFRSFHNPILCSLFFCFLSSFSGFLFFNRVHSFR